jgi:hypothetical protein
VFGNLGLYVLAKTQHARAVCGLCNFSRLTSRNLPQPAVESQLVGDAILLGSMAAPVPTSCCGFVENLRRLRNRAQPLPCVMVMTSAAQLGPGASNLPALVRPQPLYDLEHRNPYLICSTSFAPLTSSVIPWRALNL